MFNKSKEQHLEEKAETIEVIDILNALDLYKTDFNKLS